MKHKHTFKKKILSLLAIPLTLGLCAPVCAVYVPSATSAAASIQNYDKAYKTMYMAAAEMRECCNLSGLGIPKDELINIYADLTDNAPELVWLKGPISYRYNDDTITSPEALRGKTIAGPQGTILHELLVAYLATGGMTLNDVSFVNTTIPDAMSAMMGGSVDCALLAGAAAYNTQASGAHLVTNGDGLVEASICCATTQKFYDEHKDVVDSFLKAQQNVLNFLAENEETALQEAADFLDLDIQAVKDMYGYYNFDMTIHDSDITAMESTMRFMLDNDMIEKEVDINALVIR